MAGKRPYKSDLYFFVPSHFCCQAATAAASYLSLFALWVSFLVGSGSDGGNSGNESE